ncbi:MAG: hypothetical protein KTR33_04400 [Gammaproteobacteria bacterium]|nr:hypothetical protein [Gammaproteobacteria bacterium]
MARSTNTVRIRNQYLLKILSLVVRLGRKNVSARVLVEAWKGSGRMVDDIFFLHFDVLFEYQFLKGSSATELAGDFNALISNEAALDIQVSITRNGEDFLQRYLQP